MIDRPSLLAADWSDCYPVSVCDADDEGEQAPERDHRRRINAADRGTAMASAHSHDLVHHHLRRLAKASIRVYWHWQPIKRGCTERGGQ
jgi:hypothetical protein